MNAFYKLSSKAVFFFVVGVTLGALFVWSLIQGILIHLSGQSALSLGYYILAWVAGLAAVWNQIQAKTIFHYAKRS